MLEPNDEAATLVVSEHEEYIWMRQLQQPEQVVRQFELWKLTDQPDLAVLKSSIENVIKHHPDLNSRFIFSEDGDLAKVIDSRSANCLQELQLATDQLTQLLSELQNKPWNAELDPPFAAYIIQSTSLTWLALSLHPILEQSYQLLDIIQMIQDQYNERVANGRLLQPLLSTAAAQISNQPTSPDGQQNDSAFSPAKISDLILTEFRQILAEPEMSAADDFFDWGGHSLLATRVIGYLQNRYGIELSFNDFFKSPTAADLANFAVVKETAIKQTATQQVSSQNIEQAPLTFTQDFLWKAYAAFNFSPIYNLPFAINFYDPIDENAFHQAFYDLLIRHASLRTLFKTEHGQVFQYTVPAASIDQYQWFWSSDQSQNLTLAEEASYQFDLSRELPIRIRLIKNPNGQQTLSFLVHHMVIDEWSLNRIMSDLETAYFARLNQQQPVWDSAANSINELAFLQQKNGLNAEHIDYWKNLLQGATYGLKLSTSAQSQTQSEPSQSEQPQVKCLELKLNSESYAAISAFSRQHHATIFSVIYTAIASALQQIAALEEIVIGTSASGRTDPHFFDTVGYLTTMVAHRIQFNPEQTFAALLENTSSMLNDSMAYADIPINHIQKSLGLADDAALIFDVYIHIHSNNALNGAFKTPKGLVQYRQILPERHESMFGLHFEIMDNLINDQHQLNLIITYQADRYPTVVVEQIRQSIQDLLAALNAK